MISERNKELCANFRVLEKKTQNEQTRNQITFQRLSTGAVPEIGRVVWHRPPREAEVEHFCSHNKYQIASVAQIPGGGQQLFFGNQRGPGPYLAPLSLVSPRNTIGLCDHLKLFLTLT